MKLSASQDYYRRAFSIIEVAIVILITSLVIFATIKATNLIHKSKIARANSLTKNSPLLQFKNIFVWLESTSKLSFNPNEAENYGDLTSSEISYGKGSITKWYDRNPNPVIRRNATTVSQAPKYFSNCIKNIPCLKFDSSLLTVENSLNEKLSDYSILMVEKRSSLSGMPLLGSDSNSLLNQSLEVGYLDSNTIYWSQGGSASDRIEFNSNLLNDNIANIHLLVNASNKSNSSNLKYYLNGNLISRSNPATIVDFSNLTYNSQLQIGKSGTSYFNGSIGEIIILPYAISKNERIALIHYLKKKWGIK